MAHRFALGILLVSLFAGTARGESVVVVIENTQELNSFFITPFWISAHDGTFDVWSSGEPAGNFPGLEEIAEEGDTGPIGTAFENSPAGLAGGAHTTVAADNIAAPVFSPGESRTMLFDIGDPAVNRYFSYAAMVIPSNDLFIATSVPTTHELYDAAGNFTGPLTIEVYGSDVVDGGTEVNDITAGAAFSALGGTATTENNLLADIYDIDPAANYLTSIVGTTTATGATVGSTFTPTTLLARITIKKAPSPTLRLTVENLEPAGGLFATPLWVAAHDGSFDVWTGGQMASLFPGLEELAEEGMTGPIDDAFVASAAGNAGGASATITADTIPIPVFSPGETANYDFTIGDTTVNRYFSYATMVIPSNDLFVATSVPTTHELYDSLGDFAGPLVIEIRAQDIVDCGTETNDVAAGAAFSTLGGTATDENGLLTDLTVSDPAGTYLASLVGTPTPAGTIASVPAPTDVILRITISEISPVDFIRGDVNADGSIQITDAVNLLTTLFAGGAPFPCERAADVNDSNVVDLSDAVILLTHLFLQGAPPPAPFPACGVDTTPDLLQCGVFAACP
ncbi:MAG: spondin domain-containing protein [Planctomycetota bacterium]